MVVLVPTSRVYPPTGALFNLKSKKKKKKDIKIQYSQKPVDEHWPDTRNTAGLLGKTNNDGLDFTGGKKWVQSDLVTDELDLENGLKHIKKRLDYISGLYCIDLFFLNCNKLLNTKL